MSGEQLSSRIGPFAAVPYALEPGKGGRALTRAYVLGVVAQILAPALSGEIRQRRIVERSGLDRRTVQRHLEDLERTGALSCRRRQGRANRYTLGQLVVAQDPIEGLGTGVTSAAPIRKQPAAREGKTGGTSAAPPKILSRNTGDAEDLKTDLEGEAVSLGDWLDTLPLDQADGFRRRYGMRRSAGGEP